MPVVRSHAPRRMMEPLPNCFSICERARSMARDFSVLSSGIAVLPFLFTLESAGASVLHETDFFTDKSVELIRAGSIPREAGHAFAIALLVGIESLGRLETLLGFSKPVHFQAEQAELIERFAVLGIKFRRLLQMLDRALVLSGVVVQRAEKVMNRGAGLQLQSRRQMLERLLLVADIGEQGTQCGMSCRGILLQTDRAFKLQLGRSASSPLRC